MPSIAALVIVTMFAPADQTPPRETGTEPRAVEIVRREAAAVTSLVETAVGRAFLAAAVDLPEIDEPRVVYWNRGDRTALHPDAAAARDETQLEGYRRLELDEAFYYNTAYGSPVAYARAVDLAGRHGFERADGARILDFGFGGIGHLRLLASLGADCVGLEVLELLEVFYREPGDTGTIPRSAAGDSSRDGSITLLYGSYPTEPDLVNRVGGGYDLIVSKNTLKLGYIHPQREADPRTVISLGVEDDVFVRHLFDALAPGGLVLVYNIYPKQNPPEEQYLPWATGEFPFDRSLTRATGFEILAWNVDDSDVMRRMGDLLGWDEQMDLATTYAMFTVLRRPGKEAPEPGANR